MTGMYTNRPWRGCLPISLAYGRVIGAQAKAQVDLYERSLTNTERDRDSWIRHGGANLRLRWNRPAHNFSRSRQLLARRCEELPYLTCLRLNTDNVKCTVSVQ